MWSSAIRSVWPVIRPGMRTGKPTVNSQAARRPGPLRQRGFAVRTARVSPVPLVARRGVERFSMVERELDRAAARPARPGRPTVNPQACKDAAGRCVEGDMAARVCGAHCSSESRSAGGASLC
jgi:hypothetical protein